MATTPKTIAPIAGIKITAEGAENVKLVNVLINTTNLIKEGAIDYCKKHKLPYTEL